MELGRNQIYQTDDTAAIDTLRATGRAWFRVGQLPRGHTTNMTDKSDTETGVPVEPAGTTRLLAIAGAPSESRLTRFRVIRLCDVVNCCG
jgi:hypothetical protein